MTLVDQQKYFILHAPRQTGKTTTMISFVEAMNQEGTYVALYANVEHLDIKKPCRGRQG